MKAEDKKEELKLIKIKELKSREEKRVKKSVNGFTFGKEAKKEINKDEAPSPDKYDCSSEWTRKSYNLRFS